MVINQTLNECFMFSKAVKIIIQYFFSEMFSTLCCQFLIVAVNKTENLKKFNRKGINKSELAIVCYWDHYEYYE